MFPYIGRTRNGRGDSRSVIYNLWGWWGWRDGKTNRLSWCQQGFVFKRELRRARMNRWEVVIRIVGIYSWLLIRKWAPHFGPYVFSQEVHDEPALQKRNKKRYSTEGNKFSELNGYHSIEWMNSMLKAKWVLLYRKTARWANKIQRWIVFECTSLLCTQLVCAK